MEINLVGNSADGYTNPAQNSQRKPLNMGPSSQGELQRNVQRMNPMRPNNGNPRGANNMPSLQDTLNAGGKPMGGGFNEPQNKPAPQQNRPPMPNFADYGGGQDFAAAIRMYNQSTQRDRYDPAFGVMMSDSATPQDRELMGLPMNAYEGQYTVDGRRRFDQMGYGAPPNYGNGGRPTPPVPMGSNQQQGYWDQGQRGDLGRYVPPMMQDYRNPQSWYNDGGYNYNLPGAGGQFPTQGGFAQRPPRINTSRPRIDYPGG